MAPDAHLYSYFRSSCSARVRIAAQLKGIKLNYTHINLLQGGHLASSYTTVNPSSSVPTLVVTGQDGKDIVIRQSVAILEFLEEYFPSTKALLPPASDPVGRAHVRDLVNIINADTQPVTNMRILKRVTSLGGESKDWAAELIFDGLKAYDEVASSYGGKYSYGDDVTLADVVLAPAVEGALRFGVDLNRVPTVKSIYENIKVLDAFRDADWKHQPDTPEELRA